MNNDNIPQKFLESLELDIQRTKKQLQYWTEITTKTHNNDYSTIIEGASKLRIVYTKLITFEYIRNNLLALLGEQ